MIRLRYKSWRWLTVGYIGERTIRAFPFSIESKPGRLHINNMKTLSVLASLVTLGVAAPASTLTPHEITRYSTRPRAAILEDRGAPVCEYHGHISADSYTVLNHVETGFEGGSQCITVNDSSENVLSWGSTWTWSPSQWLKAYPNARVQGHRKMLSEYKSIPVSWKWR